ncbi:MAG: hypothetical protein KAW16_00755 [candidate division Zixibacteria bacterium]|nr:hypothetical protein [candidate division Zixibacteria bacterium]
MNKIKSAKLKTAIQELKVGESMKQAEKINQVTEEASKLEKSIKDLIREIDDYDLKRLLKKIDADLMDTQHNLVLAKRLAEGMPQKRKRSGK